VGFSQADLLQLIEDSLEFTWHLGDATAVSVPHDTGWRTLPFLVTAQCDAQGLLELAGGQELRGQEGAIWVPAGTRHRCAVVSGAGVSHWSCLSFRIAGGLDLCALLETPFLIAGTAALRIGEINDELAELSRQAPTLRQVVRRKELGFSMLLLGIEVSRWREDSHALAIEAQRLASVLAHIEANIAKPMRVEALARRAGLSSPRFHTVFRLATGTSPHAYLQRLRLRKAQELLISSPLSVAEVAERVGHADQFFFSRLFRKKCGMSPTAYRLAVSRGLV
jgi:AraC-like DNA-binding protein